MEEKTNVMRLLDQKKDYYIWIIWYFRKRKIALEYDIEKLKNE